MEIIKKITSFNLTNKNDTNRIKYIVMHYFGSLATSKNLADYWASKYVGASAHYAVGHDGSIYQCVEDSDIAWHCGASSYKHKECRNSNSIGIEMAVRKKNSKTLGAGDKDWYFEQATLDAAVALVRELMEKYNIPESNVIRHYDVTGKICPNPFVLNHLEYTWDTFKAAIVRSKTESTLINGKSYATPEQMAKYLIRVHPQAASFALQRANHYCVEGSAENIRGDIAFAQSLVETGNYTFTGSAVTPDQFNYGGFGVTEKGMKGLAFDSEQLGVRAHVQHLKAYANTDPLNKACVDPRFQYVQRGCAPYVEHLGIQENPLKKGWAAGTGYGAKILKILDKIIEVEVTKEDIESVLKTAKEYGSVQKPKKELEAADEFVPYEIRIHNCNALNIRPQPNTKEKEVGVLTDPKIRYTIVAEENGWGKLKSGAGWIKLSFTKRVSEQ